MTISLRTLITIEIESNHFDSMMLCYHRLQGEQKCNMIYYIPTGEWCNVRIDPHIRDEFSSKSCPFHHYLELKQLEDTKRRRGQF